MTERHRYSRADLETLRSKSRAEILDIFGSFDDRLLDEPAFVKAAAGIVDPENVPGLNDALASRDPDSIARVVMEACVASTESNVKSDLRERVSTTINLETADDALENRFTFYGEKHQLPADFSWDDNPGTRHWGHDLNRFSFLAALTRAYQQTEDTRYARKAVDLMLDWVSKCEIERCFEGTPYVFGSYLNNTIHCSVWARCLTTLLPTGIVQPVELLRILKSMHDELSYLEIVTNGHAGNWPTIGCQGALATMASLPVLRDQDRFTSYFIETLATQVEEQILPDGVQDELTPHYHAVVINNILTCAESCKKLGLQLEQRTLDTLRKMVRYQEHTVTPNRSAQVAFNDSDPESVPNVADRLRAIGMGDVVPEPASIGPEQFPYAGVAFLRQNATEGDLYLAFDGGPFGRSHQHEDKLGFWLHAYGRDLIVDPGRHLYDQSEVSYLPYLRTTHAHSTITVDGQDQNSRAHRDTWIASEPGSLTFSRDGDEVRASASYDLGYGPENAIEVTHHREIVFVGQRFWVLFDSVSGSGKHTIDSRYHFYPGDVSVNGQTAATQNPDGNLLVTATGEWDTVQVVKGQQDPRAGWYSASYNKIAPAPTLTFSRNADLPLRYAVLLLPYEGTTAPDAAIACADRLATVTLDNIDYKITSTI